MTLGLQKFYRLIIKGSWLLHENFFWEKFIFFKKTDHTTTLGKTFKRSKTLFMK